MQVENKNNCTGCGACCNICAIGAITMQGDRYGFYKPVIDKDKCINCGLCEKVCPLGKYKSNNYKEPKAYAFMNSDEIRAKSSSGGAFSAFADYILKHNGVIYGVVWDDDIKAVHYRATVIEEIDKMHGSKYVLSDTNNSFKHTKNDLDNRKLVLFTGTPCQIAGLKSYLQKEYDNLLTIDLICHGAQSPLFFERYKQDFLKDKKDEKILNINFRSKKAPWGTGYFTTTTTTKRIYHTEKDYYTSLMDLTINASCLSCQFTGIPRIADITIGDFWGVDEYDITLNDKKGTSIVLINSNKAKSIFGSIKNNYKVTEVPFEVTTIRNPNILRPTKKHNKRDLFLEDIKNTTSFKSCVKKYLKVPLHITLYRLLPQFAKNFIKYKILKMEK